LLSPHQEVDFYDMNSILYPLQSVNLALKGRQESQVPQDIMDNHTREIAPEIKEENDETRYQNEQARQGNGL